ncbi:hypothetical protein Acr_05g0009770 [Actinidia rufa]|uniref:Uncharacterized protein n=1 Tax=Actinidia rufa TaxID=165716 RepID=A0A7J0ELK5_9ERIC|nr:hypothetical protein Acr_05g0009770 [Actinidia rufa]
MDDTWGSGQRSGNDNPQMTELRDMVKMLVGVVTTQQQLLQQHFQPPQPQETKELNSSRGKTQQGETSKYRGVTEDPTIPMGSVVVVRQFLKLKPPTFKGRMNPVKANDWLIVMEKNFRLLRYYERSFTNLAEYAPYLVVTDEMRVQRFEDGLRHDIRRAIRPLVLLTYTDVLDRAIIVEHDEIERKKYFDSKRRYNFGIEGTSRQKKQKPKAMLKSRNFGNNPKGQVQVCQKCGRYHLGVCWKDRTEVMNEIRCFHFKKVGHIKRNCPRLRIEAIALSGGLVGGNVRPVGNARSGAIGQGTPRIGVEM